MKFTYQDAVFSPCRKYRYGLWRTWAPGKPVCMFIGLNPSTADEIEDDPTVRRCIRYADAWGYGTLVMTNIFAFRATNPKELLKQPDPVGSQNDFWLSEIAKKATLRVAAWGTHGKHLDRGLVVRGMIQGLSCLGLTKDGHPKHPLYLKGDLQPVAYD